MQRCDDQGITDGTRRWFRCGCGYGCGCGQRQEGSKKDFEKIFVPTRLCHSVIRRNNKLAALNITSSADKPDIHPDSLPLIRGSLSASNLHGKQINSHPQLCFHNLQSHSRWHQVQMEWNDSKQEGAGRRMQNCAPATGASPNPFS